MPEDTRLSFWECCTMTDRDRRNAARTRISMLVWGVALFGGLLLIRKELLPEGPVRWVVAIVPMLAGLWVLVTYARFVRDTDELQRKILLDALALGFGGTFFAVVGYSVLENVGAPALDASSLPLVMAGLYLLGIFFGWRRYR